jgi:hypothetical protein
VNLCSWFLKLNDEIKRHEARILSLFRVVLGSVHVIRKVLSNILFTMFLVM